jgi:hypothetical protein
MNLALVSFGDWSWINFTTVVAVWCFSVYILLGIIKVSMDSNEHDEY